MTYQELFSEFKGKFSTADVSDVKEHLAYQFQVTGEAEGIFYVEVKDGQLFIEPYEYYDRDVIFTADGELFLKLAAGTVDAVEEFTAHRLLVEGDFDKALKLQDFINKNRKKSGK